MTIDQQAIADKIGPSYGTSADYARDYTDGHLNSTQATPPAPSPSDGTQPQAVPPRATPIDGDGDVSIWVGTQEIAGWQSVQITRSAEVFPNHFTLTMTEEFSADPTRILATPGQPCQVYIGNTLAVTGYIDRYAASISPNAHQVEISGRGTCEDLLDCTVDLLSPDFPAKNGSMAAKNTLDLAQKLCLSFGIQARSAVPDLGPAITTLQISLGDKPYEVIERVARYTGYLVYEDEHGVLVLDRVGARKMASGFAQGVNIEAAASSLSVDERFTSITVVWTTIDMTSEGSNVNQSNKRAMVEDTAFASMGRKRPHIVVSHQTDGTADFAQRMANWEMARRIGRSQSVQLTCDKWRDSAGKLWQPNTMAMVNLPALKIVNRELIIATVTFRKDLSGTHADLTLMPPAAFSIQPSVLNLFDREISGGAVPKSTDPAPPNTGAHGMLGHA